MNHAGLIDFLTYAEPATCIFALVMIYSRGKLRQFIFLAAFPGIRVISLAILLPLIHASGHQLTAQTAYDIYFYVYWSSYAIEAVLGFGVIYSLYIMAMAPLKGLQRLGILMFRWAGGIALALATAMAFGPHMTSVSFIVRFVSQLQQTQSVLTLCMLLFVCLASRPMGLSYRSKLFGISLGLGILATTDLVSSAWLQHLANMNSVYNVVNGLSICSALAIWMTYFALPEPKRRMIILPTTSPFLRWNQISAALGDAPGFVAIGDVTPDMFAPAEVEIMRRASLKMTALAN